MFTLYGWSFGGHVCITNQEEKKRGMTNILQLAAFTSRPFRPLLARRFNTRSNQWSVKAFADVMESKIGDNSQLVDCILKESRGKLEVLFFSKNVQ